MLTHSQTPTWYLECPTLKASNALPSCVLGASDACWKRSCLRSMVLAASWPGLGPVSTLTLGTGHGGSTGWLERQLIHLMSAVVPAGVCCTCTAEPGCEPHLQPACQTTQHAHHNSPQQSLNLLAQITPAHSTADEGVTPANLPSIECVYCQGDQRWHGQLPERRRRRSL